MFKIKKQLLVVAAFLSIIWTASAQVPSPTINGTPPPFFFSGLGVSQSGQTFTFSGSGSGIGSITRTMPSFMSASPTTISASGTQTFSFSSELANLFLVSPNGSSGVPTFRALANGDFSSSLAPAFSAANLTNFPGSLLTTSVAAATYAPIFTLTTTGSSGAATYRAATF